MLYLLCFDGDLYVVESLFSCEQAKKNRPKAIKQLLQH